MKELNEILLNSMTNIWSNQAYVHVFDCDYITFKKAGNMFERMEIAEYIYEGVEKTSYKKFTREDDTRAGHRNQNRGQASSSHN